MSKTRWTVALVAVCLVVTAAAVAYAAGKAKAPAVPQVVRAGRFELVDGQGRLRGKLAVNSDGTPGLDLYDGAGQLRVTLALAEDGNPSVELTDKNGKQRAALFVGKSGEPGLSLLDKQGQARAELYLANMGDARLLFSDGRAQARALLVFDGDLGPSLSLRDNVGKTMATFGGTALLTASTGKVEQRSEASLVLFNRDGGIQWKAP